jgi:hypothetical protein
MAQQTAVEWLEDNLIGNPHTENDFMHNRNVFQRAKQMEKEQIIENNKLKAIVEFYEHGCGLEGCKVIEPHVH